MLYPQTVSIMNTMTVELHRHGLGVCRVEMEIPKVGQEFETECQGIPTLWTVSTVLETSGMPPKIFAWRSNQNDRDSFDVTRPIKIETR